MKKTWQLRHRSGPLGDVKLGRFEVSFPTGDENGNPVSAPKYAKVEAVVDGKRHALFLRRVKPRSTNSDVIFVSDQTAAEIPDGTEVTVSPASVESYRWYVLRNSESLKLVRYGLILAVAGAVMGAILTIAEAVGADLGLPLVLTLRVISVVVEIVGLGLVFWRGLLQET